MHELAKQIHNIAPNDIRLTFSDGDSYDFAIRSAEFFQDEFQGEGKRLDDPGAIYRISGDNDSVVVGRQGPEDDGWSTVGEVTAVELAE